MSTIDSIGRSYQIPLQPIQTQGALINPLSLSGGSSNSMIQNGCFAPQPSGIPMMRILNALMGVMQTLTAIVQTLVQGLFGNGMQPGNQDALNGLGGMYSPSMTPSVETAPKGNGFSGIFSKLLESIGLSDSKDKESSGIDGFLNKAASAVTSFFKPVGSFVTDLFSGKGLIGKATSFISSLF